MNFLSPVQTPNGPGLIQGRYIDAEHQERIMVSHPPSATITAGRLISTNTLPGVWRLVSYPPSDLVQP